VPWVRCYFANGGYHAFMVDVCPSDDELRRLEDEVGAELCECVKGD